LSRWQDKNRRGTSAIFFIVGGEVSEENLGREKGRPSTRSHHEGSIRKSFQNGKQIRGRLLGGERRGKRCGTRLKGEKKLQVKLKFCKKGEGEF